MMRAVNPLSLCVFCELLLCNRKQNCDTSINIVGLLSIKFCGNPLKGSLLNFGIRMGRHKFAEANRLTFTF